MRLTASELFVALAAFSLSACTELSDSDTREITQLVNEAVEGQIILIDSDALRRTDTECRFPQSVQVSVQPFRSEDVELVHVYRSEIGWNLDGIDVVERQLRLAIEKEPDLKLRDRLTEEYCLYVQANAY